MSLWVKITAAWINLNTTARLPFNKGKYEQGENTYIGKRMGFSESNVPLFYGIIIMAYQLSHLY